MKAKIFWVTLLLIPIIPGVFLSKWFFLGSLLFLIILLLDQFETSHDKFLAFRIHPLKTIYSEYGKFYLFVKTDKTDYRYKSVHAHLYIDKGFYFKRIHNFSFYTLDDLKMNINSYLEGHYGFEKRHSEFKHKIYNEVYKNWNGATTKQIDRDQKLDELV